MMIGDYLIFFPDERRYNRLNIARKNNTIIWYPELVSESPLGCSINKDTQNCMWKRQKLLQEATNVKISMR